MNLNSQIKLSDIKLKIKLDINQVIRVVLAIVIVLELVVVYFSLINNLHPKTLTAVANTIVRVDPKSYQETVDLLNQRADYQPPPLTLINPNPFKYSQ